MCMFWKEGVGREREEGREKEKRKRRGDERRYVPGNPESAFLEDVTAHRAHLSVDTTRLLGYLIIMDL